ncbi:DUF5954 family protein [Solwaraspora sp. WMMD1047]|uniref:DUF5954 family protein n=1 Tax=Solwaraspora sp. WMMD1047 TaxID=3016102 RepID=UPI0024162A18|nr:DUF5954 family protein [Solwaraspora sp. WMMD1047]MDG4829672.1 DUF5954 family protein [Solwaraspora sp. WMMD1047]
MTYHGEQVPEHLLIRIEHRDDPVSAVCEQDARIRSRSYPRLLWGAPAFGYAVEVAGRWRILSMYADSQPQGARDGLGSYFRMRLSETPDVPGNAAERAEYRAAFRTLDWEVVNELTVHGHRYRIIRGQPFIRMGTDGPEPPRPTDPDPYPPGESHRAPSPFENFVIDPAAATGLSDGLLRMEMVPAFYQAGIVPEAVRTDSRLALVTHPNVVLLPVGFTVGEFVAGRWQPRSFATYPTPQAARDSAAFSFTDILPHEDATIEEVMAAYDRARRERKPPRTDEFEVQGVRCRITRVETFVRVGPDGPEGPRPSDWDPEPPPELHIQQLREQGLMPDLE